MASAAAADIGRASVLADECVDFRSNGRLLRGQSFRADIGRGLEFRVRAEPNQPTWYISAGPRGTAENYLWLVSPPFQTAPHTVIGAAYGETARRSAELSPRRFRFVLTREEYEKVRRLVDDVRSNPKSTLTARDFEGMGRGSIVFRITRFAVAKDADALEWITFSGRACMPAS